MRRSLLARPRGSGDVPGHDQHPGTGRAEFTTISSEDPNLGESGLLEPRSQLRVGEQSNEIAASLDSAVPDVDASRVRSIGERIEGVKVDHEMAVSLFDRDVVVASENELFVRVIQQKKAVRLQTALHLSQD